MPMMRRRMGRPGLVGTMARTAVVAGTASAVVGASQRSQQAKVEAGAQQQAALQATAQTQADVAAMQAQVAQLQAAAPAAGAAAPETTDITAQLMKLAELKGAGVLSDEEFAAAKAKLLA